MRVLFVSFLVFGASLAKPSVREMADSQMLSDAHMKAGDPSHDCTCADDHMSYENDYRNDGMTFSEMNQFIVREVSDMLLTNPFPDSDMSERSFCSGCLSKYMNYRRTCKRLVREGMSNAMYLPQCVIVATQMLAECCRT